MRNVTLIIFIILSLGFTNLFAMFETTPQFIGVSNTNSRIKYVNELEVFFNKLNNNIISLSPKEDEWLDNELKKIGRQIDIKKWNNLRNTREYSVRESKNHIDRILDHITTIKLGIKTKRVTQEMFGWSGLVYSLNQPTGWQAIRKLIQYQTIDSKILHDGDEEYAFFVNNGTFSSNTIQELIIRQYIIEEFTRDSYAN